MIIKPHWWLPPLTHDSPFSRQCSAAKQPLFEFPPCFLLAAIVTVVPVVTLVTVAAGSGGAAVAAGTTVAAILGSQKRWSSRLQSPHIIWVVVSTPLKNKGQLGWWNSQPPTTLSSGWTSIIFWCSAVCICSYPHISARLEMGQPQVSWFLTLFPSMVIFIELGQTTKYHLWPYH